MSIRRLVWIALAVFLVLIWNKAQEIEAYQVGYRDGLIRGITAQVVEKKTHT